MISSLFCLYIAAIVLQTVAKSLPGKSVDLAIFQKNLHGVHVAFQNSAKTNGYLLTETHFETKVKTICTQTGCSSSAKEKNDHTENDRECPKDWKTFSGNCYMLLSDKRTWDSAKSKCKTLKANLIDITSESENRWLYKTFTDWKHFLWMGATDRPKEGEWRWSSSGKLLTYNAWAKGAPNDPSGKEDCGYIFKSGGKFTWSDTPCNGHAQTICKKKA
ncbi:perlucin-like protein [Ostrea edulis]|uniref:perlucin-like protein n=1 Tax=Ostrea edulis TaxID=37623 RepID=UPI0024AECD08|nr:perlucin-like protein [Ostrea edulis]